MLWAFYEKYYLTISIAETISKSTVQFTIISKSCIKYDVNFTDNV